MRATRHAGSPLSSARTSAITGASLIAELSRSLLELANAARSVAMDATLEAPAWCDADAASGRSAPKTSFVATATPGLTRIAGSRGRSSGAERISPMPRIRRGRGSRQTGTSAPVAHAACMRRGSSLAIPFARAMSRSAAAASLDPPPKPAATGRRFERAKRPSLRPSICAARACAALSTRLSRTPPDAGPVGPLTLNERAGPGVRRKTSATAAKATRLSISW